MDQDGQKKPEEADRSAEYAADRGQRQEQRNRRPLTALLWLVLAAVIVTGEYLCMVYDDRTDFY